MIQSWPQLYFFFFFTERNIYVRICQTATPFQNILPSHQHFFRPFWQVTDPSSVEVLSWLRNKFRAPRLSSDLLGAPSLLQTNENHGGWFRWLSVAYLQNVDEHFHAVGWVSLTDFQVMSSESQNTTAMILPADGGVWNFFWYWRSLVSPFHTRSLWLWSGVLHSHLDKGHCSPYRYVFLHFKLMQMFGLSEPPSTNCLEK